MILLVADVYKAKGVCGDSPWIVESAVSGSLWAEGAQKPPGRVQHLDAMVVAIGNYKLPDAINRHAGETIKLTLAVSVRAELLLEVSARVEYLQNTHTIYIPHRRLRLMAHYFSFFFFLCDFI